MHLLTANQIRQWDQYTIEHEPITSTNLMERAAATFVEWFMTVYPDTSSPLDIVCGNGNNGGDGLVAARLLRNAFYDVNVYIIRCTDHDSSDFTAHLNRLSALGDVPIVWTADDVQSLRKNSIIIDAIFGTGISRPISGAPRRWIQLMNSLPNPVISIDMPSGMPTDDICRDFCVIANQVFTFQVPKLSFFFKENDRFCPEWIVGDIGLKPDFLHTITTNTFLTDNIWLKNSLKNRERHCYKGTFGHALMMAGSSGKSGACILSTKACLKTGAGLVTAFTTEDTAQALLHHLPEAMTMCPNQKHHISGQLPDNLDKYTIGVGPGLGTHPETIQLFESLLQSVSKPMVLDADALNILAQKKQLFDLLPKNSILTPHPGEFERLFGVTVDEKMNIELAISKSVEYNLIIVLKGAYSRIFLPDGSTYINTTGNAGMATAGSGDVLTGIILGLLAQNYEPHQAAIIGTYLHGLAGTLALQDESLESLTASDIIAHLGKAFKWVRTDA